MEKTALVIATRKYYDIEIDRLIYPNEELNVSLKRSVVLIKEKVCELVEIC